MKKGSRAEFNVKIQEIGQKLEKSVKNRVLTLKKGSRAEFNVKTSFRVGITR